MRILGFCVCLSLIFNKLNIGYSFRMWRTKNELENHISPEDLREFDKIKSNNSTTNTKSQEVGTRPVPDTVDCFGLGPLAKHLRMFNMQPGSSGDINTHFYFSSRSWPERVQVFPGAQFGLDWVHFNPRRRTVLIVHGFMSHSNASWVTDMTRAFLDWEDVNVIAVDWSKGGNTWKYWRAVANTRRVGSDIKEFLKQVMSATGARVKDFHFIGHSLGAHISSYASYHLGRVGRITGLDPAQPCFKTTDGSDRLDDSDADFVDIIHTNGRHLSKIGFGLPYPAGHADFYPNGGMNQPGCANSARSVSSQKMPDLYHNLKQAVCSHGRAYLLFTESLINSNCTFLGHRWNLTYEGVNASLSESCKCKSFCAEMGIHAVGGNRHRRAAGPYFVLTTGEEPYCPTDWDRVQVRTDLLRDLREGFRLDSVSKPTTIATRTRAKPVTKPRFNEILTTTTKRSWYWWQG